MKKLATCILAIIILVGCSAAGPTYSSLPNTQRRPKEGMAQLVIYRPDSFKYMARTLDVGLGGNYACDLPNGSFLIKDTDKDRMAISASLWGLLGTSRIMLNPEAGKQYFVKVSVDNAKFSAAVANEESQSDPDGSSPDTVMSNGSSPKAGPFLIELIDEKAAKAELQTLTVSTNCH